MEHNPVSQDEANALMKKYMTENKKSYRGVFEDIKTMMEEDGFFDLSGLNELLEDMNKSAEETKPVKKPQDHKKKQTSKKSSETTE